uniref:Uncharacterized protein n=2 Tax=Picea TaxID=3328 RepID=A0A101LXY7_PICGL|nr:hypothetical protein ABT39_MTgene5418 [Picea glauca]QHR91475.1 hypothetical protein Q903MT_gene5510 [Picea sitchensis]
MNTGTSPQHSELGGGRAPTFGNSTGSVVAFQRFLFAPSPPIVAIPPLRLARFHMLALHLAFLPTLQAFIYFMDDGEKLHTASAHFHHPPPPRPFRHIYNPPLQHK